MPHAATHWVSELLDGGGRNWDYNKIRAIFIPADAEAIAPIKLSERRTADILAWHPEKTGIFSVCSSYRLGLDLQHGPQTASASSAPTGERSQWCRIWKAAVPPKYEFLHGNWQRTLFRRNEINSFGKLRPMTNVPCVVVRWRIAFMLLQNARKLEVSDVP